MKKNLAFFIMHGALLGSVTYASQNSSTPVLKISPTSASSALHFKPPLSDIVPSFKIFPNSLLSIIASYLNASDISPKLWAAGLQETLVLPKNGCEKDFPCHFNSDGAKIVAASWYEAQIWDATNGKLLQSLARPDESESKHENEINSVNFSPDDTKIVTTCGCVAMIWNISDGRLLRTLQGCSGWVTSATFSPDGKKIATLSNDNAVRIWNEVDAKLLGELRHAREVVSAYFNPDSTTIITAGNGEPIQIWDVKDKNIVHVLQEQGNDSVNSANFSPDSTQVIAARSSGLVQILDAKNGNIVRELRGHTDSVTSANFSPDGNTIATISKDRTARIWNAHNGQVLRVLLGHKALGCETRPHRVQSVNFSSNGSAIVTTGEHISARIWKSLFSTVGITMEQISLIWLLEKHTHIKNIVSLQEIAQVEALDMHQLETALNSFRPEIQQLIRDVYFRPASSALSSCLFK